MGTTHTGHDSRLRPNLLCTDWSCVREEVLRNTPPAPPCPHSVHVAGRVDQTSSAAGGSPSPQTGLRTSTSPQSTTSSTPTGPSPLSDTFRHLDCTWTVLGSTEVTPKSPVVPTCRFPDSRSHPLPRGSGYPSVASLKSSPPAQVLTGYLGETDVYLLRQLSPLFSRVSPPTMSDTVTGLDGPSRLSVTPSNYNCPLTHLTHPTHHRLSSF